MSKMIPAGIVTAYGAAVRGGYLGTYEEFCAALGDLARVLEEFEGFSVSVTTLEPGEPATADYSDGVLTLGIPAGETGNGIQSAELNPNYTLTLTWTNGESTTVGPIRGATGQTPDFAIGTVQTLQPDQEATATITGTPENPVLNLGIPKGDPGQDGASDAGAVTFDPEDDYNDGTVGKVLKDELNAISQLDASKAPVIINTASGDIASFADGAGGMKIRKIVGTILPVQSGTGDPSPVNERPISGWIGANIKRTGKNLFNPQVILDAGGSYSEGVYSATQAQMQAADFSYLKFKPNTQYYIYAYGKSNGTNTGHAQRIQINYTDGTISYVSVLYCGITDYSEKSGTSTANKSIASIKFSAYGATVSSEFTKFMICEASDRTDYEAFKGITTLPINWQTEAGTIYGGSITLNEDGSADVVATWTMKEFDGSSDENWTFSTSNRAYIVVIPYPLYVRTEDGHILCNRLRPIRASASTNNNVAFVYGVNTIGFRTDATLTSDNIHEWLQNNPLQMCYELATPILYHFPDVGTMLTHYGTNNVWIDTGSITECDYPADTKLYVDGLTAPDEDMIANANIASGKYFVVNNQLYLSTAAIAAGASIVPGTNCTATSLAEALNAINT